jgi:hypothetical protein
MASTINRQVAQALLKVLKAKDTSVGQKLRCAELIRVFQGVGPATPSTPATETVQPESASTLDL